MDSVRINPTSYRFTARQLEVADRIAADLGTSRTTVFAYGLTLLAETLGYKTQDAVQAIEEVERDHGSEAMLVVTLDDPATGSARIEVDGKPLDDWSADVTMALDDEGHPLSDNARFYARYEPLRTTFRLGEVEIEGSARDLRLVVPVKDLLDRVLMRSAELKDRSAAERRRDLRQEFETRREISRLLVESGHDPIAGGDRPDD
jgi:hypothetical protein